MCKFSPLIEFTREGNLIIQQSFLHIQKDKELHRDVASSNLNIAVTLSTMKDYFPLRM